MEKNQIQTTDTIYHITQVIKEIRNIKKENFDKIVLDAEEVVIAFPFAIFTVSDESNYFAQITMDTNPMIMHAEISNVQEDEFKLPYYKHLEIQRMGWNIPSKESYPNYWHKFSVASETECYTAAAEIVLALIKFFDYHTDLPIKVEMDCNETVFNRISSLSKLDMIKSRTRKVLLFLAKLLEKKIEV